MGTLYISRGVMRKREAGSRLPTEGLVRPLHLCESGHKTGGSQMVPAVVQWGERATSI